MQIPSFSSSRLNKIKCWLGKKKKILSIGNKHRSDTAQWTPEKMTNFTINLRNEYGSIFLLIRFQEFKRLVLYSIDKRFRKSHIVRSMIGKIFLKGSLVSYYQNFKYIYFWLAKLLHSLSRHAAFKNKYLGFPGGTVVESLPANAGDTGSSPGLGGSHMPRSN